MMSLLLVAGVSVGVFASSTLALQGTTRAEDAPAVSEYAPFERLYWAKGGIGSDTTRGGASIYRIEFGTKFVVDWDFSAVPTIVFEQVMAYPTFNGAAEFVGAVPLPMGSHQLTLRIQLEGECFEEDGQRGWVLSKPDPACHDAMLYLDGEPFEVGGLFKAVRSRLRPITDQPGGWRLSAFATFRDPGIGFPIVTMGPGGSTIVLFGDFGGIVYPTEVGFISRPAPG